MRMGEYSCQAWSTVRRYTLDVSEDPAPRILSRASSRAEIPGLAEKLLAYQIPVDLFPRLQFSSWSQVQKHL